MYVCSTVPNSEHYIYICVCVRGIRKSTVLLFRIRSTLYIYMIYKSNISKYGNLPIMETVHVGVRFFAIHVNLCCMEVINKRRGGKNGV